MTDPMTDRTGARREFAVAILVGAGAAGLALYAASRTWVVEEAMRPEPLPPLGIERSGGSLVPALPAFALVGLAGVGALLATRGRARLIVALVLAAAGLGVFLAAFAAFDSHADSGPWPLVAMLAGLVLAGVGMTALRRSASWPAMGSRYDRPAVAGARTAAPPSPGQVPTDRNGDGQGDDEQPKAEELWDAIDRGDDPTERGEVDEHPPRPDP